MKLLLVAVVIHVLFLLSIFYIHFQSPILEGLPDGEEHDQPPADRLVLFVSDGLRAESFLKYNLKRTSFLRSILLERGVFGISSTRVPTESRPGHAALLGGVYEDPSAVFRGWKENPVEFDSVLNRSSISYCWGSPDIVHMFSRGATPGRVHVAAYDSADESFALSANTSLLDIWVFDRVRSFLSSEPTKRDVLSKKKVILFLHLLGLDTAGHVHKPHSELFTENLITVDRGIESIVEQVERATENDGRTAYIFTSDHGMTDQGSHGAGDPLETETPFLAWGAGINYWQGVNPGPDRSILEMDDKTIPVHHIHQADAAPLMAALLGISVPKNSLGKLPRSFLNVSEEYAAWSMRNNANQLLAQYNRWQRESESKMLQWLTSTKQTSFKVLIEALQKEIEDAVSRKQYSDVQSLCKMLMDTTLTAIEYFQSYYKPHLFLALTLTMFGWLLLLAKDTFAPTAGRIFAVSRSVALAAILFATIIVIFNVAQNTPKVVVLYFVVPIVLWGYIGSYWREYAPLLRGKAVLYFMGFVIATEALVLAFMDRRLLAPLLWVHCLLVIKPLLKGNALNASSRWMLVRWVACNVLLSGFFVLPTIGRDSSNVLLLCTSILAWTVTNLVVVNGTKHSSLYKGFVGVVQLLQATNYLLVIYYIETSQAIPQWSRWLCWVFSALGMLAPFFSTISIADRILALFSGLSGPYMMLSLSYEPLFLLCFCYTLYLWMAVENTICNRETKLEQLNFRTQQQAEGTITFNHTRRTFGFMLFLLASFFGTGNLATVSSFDPNWVRCFVSTFSPFTMMALIVLKLLIPVVLLICVLKAMVIVTSVQKTKMFNLTLIVCDWMCLNFFFLVRNEGSWMEIGSSISHFVILECTTIVVMMMYELARIVTEVSFRSKPLRTQQTLDQLGAKSCLHVVWIQSMGSFHAQRALCVQKQNKRSYKRHQQWKRDLHRKLQKMEDSRYLPNQTEQNLAQQNELKQELIKYYKSSLIIGLLKQPDAPISIENRAFLATYRHDEDLPLGLDHIRNVDISYHERNTISKYIESNITEQVRPYVEKAKQFTGGNLEQLAESQYHEQHINLQLDHDRQQLSNELAQLKARKLQLMKACAEIRTGPYQRNNVELKHAEACSIDTKHKMLQKLTANEILNCTPHAVKAVQEVAANVNTLIEFSN